MPHVASGVVPRARSNTRRRTPPQELRVVRGVAPHQPELFGALALLRGTTSNFVEYKDTDELGVTLLMLGPLMRSILGVGPGQRVPPKELRTVETALNDRLAHTRYQDYDIPLEDTVAQPLDLYGRRRQYLGISLRTRDLRMIGDRAVAAAYFRETYGVSNRELGRRLKDLRPHVTIGEVRYDQMTATEADTLRVDPSAFILGAARTHQEREVELGLQSAVTPVVFPDVVSLNGLRIFCQPKGT